MTTHGQNGFDQQVTAALEAVPDIVVPDDFAARVMSRVPAQRLWTRSLPARASIGRRVAMIAAVVLIVAMIAFAAPAHDTNQLSRTLVLWIFAAEFVALTLWLAVRRGAQR